MLPLTKTGKAPLLSRETGAIGYRHPAGHLVGIEHFNLLHTQRGHTLQASCELHDVGLIREVTLMMDSRWFPKDGFLRLTENGCRINSSWFRFDDDEVTVTVALRGQDEQCITLSNDPEVPYLGLHPLQGDALITTLAWDADENETRQINGLTNSISENGDKDSGVAEVSIAITYLGQEELTVTAGTFTAKKFALNWHHDWPDAYVWVMSDSPVFLKMIWAQVDTWYELLSFSRDAF